MNKKVIQMLLVSSAVAVLTAGCFWSKPSVPQAQPKTSQGGAKVQEDNEDHYTLTKNQITFTVSNKPKYFSQTMIPAAEGKVVVGILIAYENNSPQELHIDPNYIEITTKDGKKYRYSETKTEITGTGAFKSRDLPFTYRGGGLLLFEIGAKEVVKSVKSDDGKGHVFEIDLLNPPKNQ